MRVFISWSGDRSGRVAQFLKEWISCVLQNAKPWVSSKDIDRGSLWFSEISQQLGETSVGIICLTQENKERPWILFEAGALAKGLQSSRVCTLLIDLEPSDIRDPLAQFNHTAPTKESMYALIRTINTALGDKGLDIPVLEKVFETYYPQFESELKVILDSTTKAKSTPRKSDDVLEEILENTRALNSRVRRLESEALSTEEDLPRRIAAAVRRADMEAMVGANNLWMDRPLGQAPIRPKSTDLVFSKNRSENEGS